MKYIIDEIYCTGCAACANVCPNGAIEIVQDKKWILQVCDKRRQMHQLRVMQKKLPYIEL